VLLGMRAASVKDFITTPTAVDEFGVDVHGATINQLLRMAIKGDKQLRFLPNWMYVLWTLLWSVAGGLLGYRIRRPLWEVAGAAGGLALLIFIAWMAFRWAWWAPAVGPGISWIAAAALVGVHVSYHERSDRLLLKQMFSTHASSGVVDELWNHREELLEEGRLKPKTLTATVMFTDLRGFAKVAEQMTPEAMIDWVNGLMDPMSRLVYRHHGMIKQYAGDAIMALFGIPLTGPEGVAGDVRDAVCCALAMRRRLAQINRRWRLMGQPEIEMRIGICTGPLVAGSIGGRARTEYTVIGDTVNLASRLESFEKDLRDADIAANGCRILIHEETNVLLDARFTTRYVKTAVLTGNRQVRIYGVIDGPDVGRQVPDAAAVARST
jgi:adenylate cyclase